MLCWGATRCTCLPPSWPCLVTPSPTTPLLSTCPPRRRCVWGQGLGPRGSLLPTHPTCLSPQRSAWAQQEPGERKLNFLPRKFPSLRAVPAYGRFVQERFERCLDLYLCPRQRKMRVCGVACPGARGWGLGDPLLSCPGERGPRRPHPQTAAAQGPAAFPHVPGPGEWGPGAWPAPLASVSSLPLLLCRSTGATVTSSAASVSPPGASGWFQVGLGVSPVPGGRALGSRP